MQFVNNECVNNTLQIINSNAISSKKNETLVLDRISGLLRTMVIMVILTAIIINIINYFHHIIHQKFSTKTYGDLNIKLMNCSMVSRSLSPRHGTSSGCGWRNSLQYGG